MPDRVGGAPKGILPQEAEPGPPAPAHPRASEDRRGPALGAAVLVALDSQTQESLDRGPLSRQRGSTPPAPQAGQGSAGAGVPQRGRFTRQPVGKSRGCALRVPLHGVTAAAPVASRRLVASTFAGREVRGIQRMEPLAGCSVARRLLG